MKKILLTSIVFSMLSAASQAVTLQVSIGGALTLLGDDLGTPTADMIWGILVDTGGDGYNGFTTAVQSGAVTIGEGLVGSTDDYLYLASNPTLSGANSGLAAQINYDLVASTTSKDYALVWFTDGVDGAAVTSGHVGLAQVSDQTAGSNSENLDLTDFRGQTLTASIEVIPEPSSALLVSLAGGLALLRRRR